MSHQVSPSADTIVATPQSPSKQTRHSEIREAPRTQSSVAEIVPPEHPFRTLVLCFDGTGDQFDQDNSNIVQFFNMLKKDDRTKQMVYYQSGIGTYTTPQVATPFMSNFSKQLDVMIAWNLDAHVMGGYEFLMQNYTVGDRICIFGFSRGAYTARALAGMVHKVGLLPACNHEQVPFAYKIFTRTDDLGWEQSTAFKNCFSIDVDIEFIGVWDTVGSVGVLTETRLPFTTSNTSVRTFRHAVSLDERRAKFKANLWNFPNEKEARLGTDGEASLAAAAAIDFVKLREATAAASDSTPANPPPKDGNWSWINTDSGKAPTKRAVDEEDAIETSEALWGEKDKRKPTDIEEVWFAGCHCDVGGGSVDNKRPHTLARIPLRWMIRECFKTRTGIMFDVAKLRNVGLDPATLYPIVKARPPPLPCSGRKIRSTASDATKGSLEAELAAEGLEGDMDMEEHEELKDALSPVYDQLSLKWHWWILEYLPIKQRFQHSDKTWATEYKLNSGNPRIIPRQKKHAGIKVHRSVKLRMEAEHEDGSGKYKPRAQWQVDPIWVD